MNAPAHDVCGGDHRVALVAMRDETLRYWKTTASLAATVAAGAGLTAPVLLLHGRLEPVRVPGGDLGLTWRAGVEPVAAIQQRAVDDLGGLLVGVAVATIGILLPSFCFVLAVNPLIPRLRASRWASRFLDAVNAASIGLMAAVAVSLAHTTLLGGREGHAVLDIPGCMIALVSAAVALRWRIAPGWLIVAGAIAGRLVWALGPMGG